MNWRALTALLISPTELSASRSITSLGGRWNVAWSIGHLEDFLVLATPELHSVVAIFSSVLTSVVCATGLKLESGIGRGRWGREWKEQ